MVVQLHMKIFAELIFFSSRKIWKLFTSEALPSESEKVFQFETIFWGYIEYKNLSYFSPTTKPLHIFHILQFSLALSNSGTFLFLRWTSWQAVGKIGNGFGCDIFHIFNRFYVAKQLRYIKARISKTFFHNKIKKVFELQ